MKDIPLQTMSEKNKGLHFRFQLGLKAEVNKLEERERCGKENNQLPTQQKHNKTEVQTSTMFAKTPACGHKLHFPNIAI